MSTWSALSTVPVLRGGSGLWIFHRNYAWNAKCIRRWLFITSDRRVEGDTWWRRMEHAIKMTFVALLFGASILVHCAQGKHRSGAFGCFMFCLLCDCSLDQSLSAYRTRNRRIAAGHDIKRVRDIWRKNGLQAALEYFRGQQWVLNMIGNIMYKIFEPTVRSPLTRAAQPKWRPLAQPKRRPLAQSAEPPVPPPLPESDAPHPKRRRVALRPSPKWAAASSASSDATWADTSDEVVVVDADTQSAVHRPMSDIRRSALARAMADVLVDRTPSPTRARRLAWQCEACGNLNNRTSHHCSQAGCKGKLPQRMQQGDWECLHCGHMNRRWRDHCNWSHCPSNDWVCPSCDNLNFGDRRVCNGRDPPCRAPRPWSLR